MGKPSQSPVCHLLIGLQSCRYPSPPFLAHVTHGKLQSIVQAKGAPMSPCSVEASLRINAPALRLHPCAPLYTVHTSMCTFAVQCNPCNSMCTPCVLLVHLSMQSIAFKFQCHVVQLRYMLSLRIDAHALLPTLTQI